MNRVIRCDVQNEFIRGAGQVIGAAGSHDDVELELAFSPVWEGTAKSVVWFDALGENPVITQLGTDLLVSDTLDTYRVRVPAEAKAVEGDMRLTIRGVHTENGVETRAVVAATAGFRVLPALWDPLAEESADITPTRADQLRQELEAIKSDIVDAAHAARALEDTREARDEALTAQAASEAAQARAEEARTRAETAGASAQADREGAQEARAGAEAARDGALAARNDAQTAKTGADAAWDGAYAARTAAEAARDAARDRAADAAGSAASARAYSGRPPVPRGGTWWLWDAETGAYTDSGVSSELEGPPGVGVERAELTRGDHSPGNTDIYTITLTNGEKLEIPVYNGRNGLGVGDVLGVQFELTVPADAWDGGRAVVQDSRLLALGTYKYLLWPEESCREEALLCGVLAGDILESGSVALQCHRTPETELTLHVLRLQLAANSVLEFQGRDLAEILREVLLEVQERRQDCCETADDEEVLAMLESVFGRSETECQDNTATDEEVEEMLKEVFGP